MVSDVVGSDGRNGLQIQISWYLPLIGFWFCESFVFVIFKNLYSILLKMHVNHEYSGNIGHEIPDLFIDIFLKFNKLMSFDISNARPGKFSLCEKWF
jgi:hypothetical protein